MFKHWRTEEDMEIDKLNGIERQPQLGCFIVVCGSILFWSLIY